MKKIRAKEITKILNNPDFRGKHIIMIRGEVFASSTAKGARHLFERLTKKYPGNIPTITYIPKEDALILCQF